MATTINTSQHFKEQLGSGNINLSSDSVMVVLMEDYFTFHPDMDDVLDDITLDQIPTDNGYTQDNKMLSGISFDRDDVNFRAVMTCDDISWTASGGDIGPFAALALIDTTTADDTLIGCAEFDPAITITDGLSHYIRDIEVEIA